MSFDIMLWLAAAAPVLALLLLLLRCRWGGDEAAAAALLVSIFAAHRVFGGSFDLIALAVAKGMWSALSIIFVIFPALLMYEVSRAAGAFQAIREGMQTFTPDQVLQVIAVGWVFVDFLQGITGFGVPVVVCAPLLVSMGVRPLPAVVITLLGQTWGNTFGTLGLAWEGLASQVDFTSPVQLQAAILWTGNLLIFVNLATGTAIAWIAGGKIWLRRNFLLVFTLALLQGVGQASLALINPVLCNFVVAAFSMGIIFLVGKLPWYRKPATLEDALQNEAAPVLPKQNHMTMAKAFLPYLFLVVMAVAVLLNDSLKNFLGQWTLALSFAGKTTGLGFVVSGSGAYAPLVPMLHSGAFLLLTAGSGYIFYRRWGCISAGSLGSIMKKSLDKTIPAGVAVVGLIAMSKVMEETGQTVVLAQGAALLTGKFYPFLAPFTGLLGTFMTASNLSSNILFGGFQQQIALMLGLDKAPLLAAQTVGGAVGSMLSPSKILLGTTSVGILGQEGAVMRKVIGLALFLCMLMGMAVLLSYE